MFATVSVSRLTADQRPTTIGLITAFSLAAVLILLAVAFERTIVHVRPFVIAAVQSNFDLTKAYTTAIESVGRQGRAVHVTNDLSQATRIVISETSPIQDHIGTIDGTQPDGAIVPTSHGTATVQPVDRPVERTEEVIDVEFTPVEREPSYEVDDLYRLIHYPEQARRLGLEGTVIVKALVMPNGTVERSSIYESDNVLFNGEALHGVQGIRFTPAQQNDHAVACWIYIPVKFRLR
ncbi:hypothetical protein BH10BAC6_BH10BAC6_03620 [soil metagenome]